MQNAHRSPWAAARVAAAGALFIAVPAVLTWSNTASAGQPPFTLGAYVGNPDGNVASNEAAFEARFNSFVATMGAAPQNMNAFVDFSQPVTGWAASASWVAWSWARSPVIGHAISPVVGVPMSDRWHWYGWTGTWSNDWFFKQIVAGAYDSAYRGIVDGWANNGFNKLFFRLGYEMDGGFMSWYMGSDPATQADWVAAFQHLSVIMHDEAAADGVWAGIVWNPAELDWTYQPVANAYPGDAYVDVISLDVYSRLFPATLYDWAIGNWTFDSSIQQWWNAPANVDHYWSYPDSSPWQPGGTGSGFGMEDIIALAAAHHKPLSISESGAGGDGVSTGPVDFPAFPTWLASELHRAQGLGVAVWNVDVWDTWMSDGDWAFSMPGDGKPLEAAAWAQAFGASSD